MKTQMKLLLLSCALAGSAAAQTRPTAQKQDPGKAEYTKTTHLRYDEGDEVLGVMQRPDGDVVHVRSKAGQRSLLRVRTSFHYEMVKSAEIP